MNLVWIVRHVNFVREVEVLIQRVPSFFWDTFLLVTLCLRRCGSPRKSLRIWEYQVAYAPSTRLCHTPCSRGMRLLRQRRQLLQKATNSSLPTVER